MRRLAYVMVEFGRCQHCGRDAAFHSIDGICTPQGRMHENAPADVPRPCYRGLRSYGFVDLDNPHDIGELAIVLNDGEVLTA